MSVRTIKTPKAFAALYSPARHKVYWGGRAAGRSTAFADAILALADRSPLRVLCTREIQRSIKKSVHKLLADRIAINGYTNYQVLETEIRHVNGSEIFFAGLYMNIDSIKSIEGIDICWIEEANTVSEDSLKKLIPTIRKPGSEIWASFNPELKSDAIYQRYVVNPPANAHVQKVSYLDNPWLSQELLDEMQHLKATNYDEYLHVWEGELKAFADGAIYAKQLKTARVEERLTSIPVESGLPVYTFWDLGRNDAMSIWFMQKVGLQHRFIDYYENRLVDLDHYLRVLKEKNYLYGTHFLPHDADVINLGTGNRSRVDILRSGGLADIEVVPRIPNLMEGIELTRQSLSSCWFDTQRCERGLDCLANYQFLFDDKYMTHREKPLHNWASNGADAFRQFAQGFKEPQTYTDYYADQAYGDSGWMG